MAKNKTNRKKKSNLPLLFAAIVVLCLTVVVMVIPKGNKSDDVSDDTKITTSDTKKEAETSSSVNNTEKVTLSKDEETDSSDEEKIQVIEAGGSLVIPVSEISETAQFYPVEIDGTSMEVLAVKDSDGNIRTAFNTCQICYGSGRGYYVQVGNVLVCQNCGNRFTVNQVEIQTGGCNPWPIFEKNKTVTEDSVEISYDFLKESKEIFSNWKINY